MCRSLAPRSHRLIPVLWYDVCVKETPPPQFLSLPSYERINPELRSPFWEASLTLEILPGSPRHLQQTPTAALCNGLVATIPLLLEQDSTRAGLGLTHLSWDTASTEESLMWPQRKDCQQTLVQARGHSVLLSLSFPYLSPRHYGYAI